MTWGGVCIRGKGSTSSGRVCIQGERVCIQGMGICIQEGRGICTQEGEGVCIQGRESVYGRRESAYREGLGTPTPSSELLKQVVRILLECFLVVHYFCNVWRDKCVKIVYYITQLCIWNKLQMSLKKDGSGLWDHRLDPMLNISLSVNHGELVSRSKFNPEILTLESERSATICIEGPWIRRGFYWYAK